ncbi:hypothetical protein C8D77_113132 [Mesorhizobium loti]|uniref:Uncharacterized protein n=1 Tax=Rhizobium loti TaxID=381 RepID=A0A8E2W7P5_RHILI|nr:hypothetical protein C8D77_113132 [Mesorhizobium loti]
MKTPLPVLKNALQKLAVVGASPSCTHGKRATPLAFRIRDNFPENGFALAFVEFRHHDISFAGGIAE